MATTIQPQEKPPQVSIDAAASLSARAALRQVSGRVWLVLLVAFAGFAVFAYQIALVPQDRDYTPNWHGAQWIAAPQPNGVAYFRKTFTLPAPPLNAFAIAQGNQDYALYVNGQPVDTTRDDFDAGITNRAYIYDLSPRLRRGQNTLAFRVENRDVGAPALRVVVGIDAGSGMQFLPSDLSWKTTTDPQLAHPLHPLNNEDWRGINFGDDAWLPATFATGAAPRPGVLRVDQALYETAPPAWISDGAAPDAFFYQTFTSPASGPVWLRVTATGQAAIFINGRLMVSQPPRARTGAATNPIPSSAQVTTGYYDISAYLRQGRNDLAAHVSAVGMLAPGNRLHLQPAALALDVIGPHGRLTETGAAWRMSATASPGWTTGEGVGSWARAISADASAFGVTATYLLPATGAEQPDLWDALGVLLATALLFALGCGVSLALQGVSRRHLTRAPQAVTRLALTLIPTVLAMGLLVVISWEPLIPRPFPFTPLWLGALIALAVAPSLALALVPRWRRRVALRVASPLRADRLALVVVGILALVGFVMAAYQLGYESMWQDEVTSVYAAQGVLHDGVPHLLSGFIYPKAELYSAALALVMAVFGDHEIALRSLSVVEYVASLIMTYVVGRRLFDRGVGLLAMGLLVASPMALRWGREARMYQQAELLTLLVVYVFYRAAQPQARPRVIYASMALAVAMYLSHEETLVILPALALYLFATRGWRILREHHWLIAGLSAVAVIGLQLLAVKFTHPPILGTDRSQQPLITPSIDNVNYYALLFFNTGALSNGTLATLTLTSIFAFGAMVGALFSRNRALRYLAVIFGVALFMLVFLFSPTADRYIFPLLPVIELLAAVGMLWFLRLFATYARQRFSGTAARGLTVTCGVFLIGAMVVGQMIPFSNFGLATSRAAGLSYYHHYPVYAKAGDYIRAHWQPGDILVTLAPAIDGAYYAHQPSYLIYQSKALYLFERDGHIIDTPTGSIVLLNDADVNEMIAQHHRIWLLAADSYPCCDNVNTFPIAQYFALVYENAGTFVYLRSG